ncbi:MAG: hypothetical protein M1834_004946 [Cirrosporium novae-zelandiae]|nr:MAG: hypothetical protein M1834_004946 [Cirrosporium novae-zelandiae]
MATIPFVHTLHGVNVNDVNKDQIITVVRRINPNVRVSKIWVKRDLWQVLLQEGTNLSRNQFSGHVAAVKSAPKNTALQQTNAGASAAPAPIPAPVPAPVSTTISSAANNSSDNKPPQDLVRWKYQREGSTEIELATRKLVKRFNIPSLRPLPGTYILSRMLTPHGIVATSIEDIQRAVNIPSIHQVLVKYPNSSNHSSYILAPDGIPCAYRGAGPVWKNNSCAYDSIVVAGTFLDLGYIPADLQSMSPNTWRSTLNEIERIYWRSIRVDWRIQSSEKSIKTRHQLLQLILDRMPDRDKDPDRYRIGRFLPTASLWDACTSAFGQFKFNTQKICTSCHKPMNPRVSARKGLDCGHPAGSSLNAFLESQFGAGKCPPLNCQFCKQVVEGTNAVISELPPRLAIKFGTVELNKGGPMSGLEEEKIPLKYYTIPEKGGDISKEKKTTYKWIGGIYYSAKHFRVYWNDGEYGREQDTIMYCGMTSLGSFIGELKFTAADGTRVRVPSPWSDSPTILFYERVDFVHKDSSLEKVRGTLRSMDLDRISEEEDEPQAESQTEDPGPSNSGQSSSQKRKIETIDISDDDEDDDRKSLLAGVRGPGVTPPRKKRKS